MSEIFRSKVRTMEAGSAAGAGANNALARSVTARTSLRISSARGVGTRSRPARTSSGSSRIRRSLASVRLIVGAEVCRRSAAAVTLFSVSSASSATTRFMSRDSIPGLSQVK
jgi:hypothetical protein